MAVEAGHHHTLFHPQMMITNAIDNANGNGNGNGNGNATLGYGIGNPVTATMYCNGFNDSMNVLKAESGLTCSVPVSRKRGRDCSDLNSLIAFANSQNMNMNMSQNQMQNQRCGSGAYTFLGEDISLQIQQQQFEIDQFIAHQNDKVRLHIEERRKRNSRRLIAAVEETISKRLRSKEEEILKISKLNWALEEKVKSLCVENQIWRELAQTNEATANALRSNLKQVLEQVVQDEYRHRSNAATACVDDAAALAEDAQSCCESNNEEKCNINDECTSINYNNNNNNISSSNMNRLCKKCGKEESCVLLLPCRHLCLCTTCASSVNICPVCKSTKNISVHVNMS